MLGYRLPHLVKLIVPQTVNINSEAAADFVAEMRDYVVNKLSTRFGGATYRHSFGGWFSQELNQVVYEPVIEVESYASAVDEADEAFLYELSQEAVSIVVDGSMYLI
jgi:hypothetical protein